ncbi:MAG: dihydrofolate reductase [Bacteriovoracaceae bacterium]
MKIALVIARGKKNQIGINNSLPWRLKSDLQLFKQITQNHHILMGRKTFESLPGLLKNRVHLVVSRNVTEHASADVKYFTDVKSAINFAKNSGESELFIIGGAEIYNMTIDLIDTLYLTEVDFEGEADTYFHKIDFKEWENVKTEHFERDQFNSHAFDFKIFNRKK